MSKHVKVINGRKYYYKSIRKGKKVTSEYLGPVLRIRKKKRIKEEIKEEKEIPEEQTEDNYIG